MRTEESRWQQRFQSFLKAYALLEEAVVKYHNVGISELEEQGLIQRFEFTHELAWNVLKDYFEYQGNSTLTGSRDATREAFQRGLIEDGEGWMEMIKSRNKSSHTYNEDVAKEIVTNIVDRYSGLFLDFKNKMNTLKDR
jgi:nucleotidyltransferase substrate binding protein (TIGR01987 family)